jgi:hypothetical protein
MICGDKRPCWALAGIAAISISNGLPAKIGFASTGVMVMGCCGDLRARFNYTGKEAIFFLAACEKSQSGSDFSGGEVDAVKVIRYDEERTRQSKSSQREKWAGSCCQLNQNLCHQ